MAGGFRLADEMSEHATAVLARERERLNPLVAHSELLLTGASSVPGALTSGDVDLHLRVPATEFESTVDALKRIYDVVHPQIWCATLATFVARDNPMIGIAVTPVGSVHDRRFTTAWQRLRSDAAALEAYNTLKRAHGSPEHPDYGAAKSDFFDSLVEASADGPAPGH